MESYKIHILINNQWFVEPSTYDTYEEAKKARMERVLAADANWSFAPEMKVVKVVNFEEADV